MTVVAPHVHRLLRSEARASKSAHVAESLADTAHLTALCDEVRTINPLAGIDLLRELREALLQALAVREEPGVRVLLNVVAVQQSRVARAVDQLWAERGSAAFTPGLIRVLGRLRNAARSEAELQAALGAEPFAFLTGKLVEAGLVMRRDLRVEPPGGIRDGVLELSSIGARILPVLAERVIDDELGRFGVGEWPTEVVRLEVAAERANAELFPFERAGEDGRILANCVGRDPDKVGALSAPDLLAVGRTASPSPDARWRSFALLYSPGAPMDGREAVKRMGRIVGDHVNVVVRADSQLDMWRLEVLMPEGLRELEPELREVCDRESVACGFPA